MTKKQLLKGTKHYYINGPIGESFYPSPIIIYSKVTVSTKKLAADKITRTGTGYIVHEFYTAKDFPIIAIDDADADERRHRPNFILKFLNINVKDYVSVTQGYLIKRNDMHGKPKAQWVYAENGASNTSGNGPISGVEYIYRTKEAYNRWGKNELNNDNVPILKPNGSSVTLIHKTLGVDTDLVVDAREEVNTMAGVQSNINADATILPFIGWVIPSFIPIPSFSESIFRSAVTTKVIDTYGILEKTVVHDLGTSIATTNDAYDGETGAALMTTTFNEFKDPIYNVNYPAHWVYTQMEPAYINTNASLSTTITNGMTSNMSNINDYLCKGDELILTNSAGNMQRAWVLTFPTLTTAALIDDNGLPISSSSYDIKVYRSARRNQQSSSVGAFTAMKNLIDNNVLVASSAKNIINASATTFAEERKMHAGIVWNDCGNQPYLNWANMQPINVPINPYKQGVLGNMYAQKQYVFKTDRNNSAGSFLENVALGVHTNLRTDGYYTNFLPFWVFPVGGGKLIPNAATSAANQWFAPSRETVVSTDGFSLEKADAVDDKEVFSAAIYEA